MPQEVHIIGAGIGGLTTAIMLQQRNCPVNIYEGSAAIKPVGAGIIIANNAMQVYRKMGIQDKIEKAGSKVSYMKITDPKLHKISVVDLTRYEKQYGVHSIAIHRGELQNILAHELGYHHIHLSKRLKQIEKSENFKLSFEDNTTVECKILIGADGLRSVVRNQLFGKSILRNAGQMCWRGVCEIELSHPYHQEAIETWGKGKRFGFVKISDSKWYWYALTNFNRTHPEAVNLSAVFSNFHKDIQDIIAATPQEKIIAGEIIDLKPMDNWQMGNACLIGDAAHATTPNLGQGACQAIEDAYVLGELLDKGLAWENAFREYEKIRRKKAHAIVNKSWALGKMSQMESTIGIGIRNLLMRAIPNSINNQQMEKVFRLNEV